MKGSTNNFFFARQRYIFKQPGIGGEGFNNNFIVVEK